MTKKKVEETVPKVSIILVNYNRPAYLQEAIDSVINQTSQDWELVILDDCSDDPKVDIILQLFRTRLDEMGWGHKLIIQKTSRELNNISFIWNRGLDLSSGQYICTLDNDNRKCPRFVAEMSKVLDKNPDKWMAVCLSYYINESGQMTGIHRGPSEYNVEGLVTGNMIDSGEILVRRDVFDKIGYWNESIRTCEDWDFILRILLYGGNDKAILVDEPLADYRLHGDRRGHQTAALGGPGDVLKIQEKYHIANREKTRFRVAMLWPDDYKTTPSQKTVCKGICSALEDIGSEYMGGASYKDRSAVLQNHPNHVIIYSPFLWSVDEVKDVKSKTGHLISLHVEDPQAWKTTIRVLPYIDWVVCNDSSVLSNYRQIKDGEVTWYHSMKGKTYPMISSDKGCVVCMPSLSIDSHNMNGLLEEAIPASYDLAFCGYAYDSRKIFMNELIRHPRLPHDTKILLIGDGWDSFACINGLFCSVKTVPTQSPYETMRLMKQASMILLRHRTKQDIGGFPDGVEPKDIHRGYMEAGAGRCLLIDDSRNNTSLLEDEFMFYSSVEDLVEKIRINLQDKITAQGYGDRAKAHALKDFTYTARIRKLMAYIKSPRFYFKIP